MYIKLLMSIVLILFLSGCATTARKGNNIEVQQLKTRVTSLETELQTKGQEIVRLEDELEKAQEKRPVVREEKKEIIKLSVREIQTVLKNAGYYRGSIDGKAGPATTDAIIAFQKANGLKADGIVGARTKAKIIKYLTD